MEIIRSDLPTSSTALATRWCQESGEGSAGFCEELHGGIQTSRVRKGESSEPLEEKLNLLRGNSVVLPLHNRIYLGSLGNDCSEKDIKEQKKMPGKQKPSDKTEARPMVRETTWW